MEKELRKNTNLKFLTAILRCLDPMIEAARGLALHLKRIY